MFNDKHQLRKIFLNINDLILKHNIKLDNKHDFKFIFRWNEAFRIQRANLIKNIYIFKKWNEIRLERTFADNRLKRFKMKDVENSSRKQIEIYEMLNITSENSIDAIKKSNIINKNIRVNDEVWNEVARNIIESLNANNQIFENDITDNNLLNSKIRNIYAKIKFNTRRSNWLIEIENSLNSVERSTNTITFTTINEISVEKKWNAMKIEKFEIYINDCNFKDSFIVWLILWNRSFAIGISSK